MSTVHEARKDDQGKDPWNLAPWDVFRAIVRVLEHGADKYSSTLELAQDEICPWIKTIAHENFGLNVIQIDISIASENAGLVTKNISERLTKNSRHDNEKIDVNGQRKILPNLKDIMKSVEQMLCVGRETLKRRSEAAYASCRPLRQKYSSSCCNKSFLAPYAAENSLMLGPSISITTRSPVGFEESFVADAITVSGCLQKVWTCLEKRSVISRTRQSISFEDCPTGVKVRISGARNWESGMKWSRVYAALMRHMTAWWERSPCDIETGYSHLWHACCCAVFLTAYELRGVGEDDRPANMKEG